VAGIGVQDVVAEGHAALLFIAKVLGGLEEANPWHGPREGQQLFVVGQVGGPELLGIS
jgi:hypothetical protein